MKSNREVDRLLLVPYYERKTKLSTSSTVDRKFSRELSSGTTSLALLAILAQVNEPVYGYRIADSGREALERWQDLWESTCALMNRILGGDIHEQTH